MDTSSFEEEDDVLETLDNESARWDRLIEKSERHVDDTSRLVHLMDADGDKYSRIADLVGRKSRFVFRIKQYHRRVMDSFDGVDSPKLSDCFERAKTVDTRTISLSARDNDDRAPSTRAEHPNRAARTAEVEIRTTMATLRAPDSAGKDLPDSLKVNLVHVREIDPPEGESPVDWKLMTDVEINDAKDAIKVVEWYQRRWCIEEYFGVLKGGCRAEARLLRSAPTYTTAFGVLIGVAARLLLLRSVAQEQPDVPAQKYLRPTQLQALKASKKSQLNSLDITVAEAFSAIARVGGHQAHNGPPGWIIMTRGWREMTLIEIGIIEGLIKAEKERRQLLTQMRAMWNEKSPEQFEAWMAQQEAQICDQS